MPHYFLTTRNIKRSKANRFFGGEVAQPSFVIAPDEATTLDPKHKLTGTRASRRWAEEILNAARDEEGHGDIIFLVHGFNFDAQDAFKNHIDLKQNIKAAGMSRAVFVSYSWPSEGDFYHYLNDDHDARFSALHLVKSGLALFAAFSEPGCKVKMHVIAHSMGTMVVREAFKAARGHLKTREGAWGVNQLIFFGSDISAKSLASSQAQALFDKSQRFTNYFNRRDKVLATSNMKRLLSSPRLGRHGAPKEVRDKVVDIDMTDYWRELAGDNDENRLGDIPLSHSFYQTDQNFARDVALTLKGELDRRELPNRTAHSDENCTLFVKAPA